MNPPSILDVRDVEPKYRFETIMTAYGQVEVGETLDLIVDHDPKCMYYTLNALQGATSFEFAYLENGPERWRVHVTRLEAPVEAAVPGRG